MTAVVTDLSFTGCHLIVGSGSTLVCCAAQCKVRFLRNAHSRTGMREHSQLPDPLTPVNGHFARRWLRLPQLPRATGDRCHRLQPTAEMIGQELLDTGIGVETVLGTDKAVPLVRVNDILRPSQVKPHMLA